MPTSGSRASLVHWCVTARLKWALIALSFVPSGGLRKPSALGFTSTAKAVPSDGVKRAPLLPSAQPFFACPENSISFLLGVRKEFSSSEPTLAVTEGAS